MDRVLLIDHDADTRFALGQALALAGYAAEEAESGVEGLTVLAGAETPRAVVLRLSDDGDPAVLREIRERHPQLIVVTLSSASSEADFRLLLAEGANACVPSDSSGATLVPVLRNALAHGPPPPEPAAPVAARQEPRAPVSMPIRVRVETWEQYAVLHASNLSRGGVFVRSGEPPAVGTAVQLELTLPDAQVIQLAGEVAHVLAPQQAAASGRHSGAGIRFLNFTDDQRARLAALVRSAAAAPPPPAPEPERPPRGVPLDSQSELLAELRAHLADLRSQDLFSALGLFIDAQERDVRTAFRALAKRWHPSLFALQPIDVRAAVTEIFLVLRQAHDTLVDFDGRSRHRTQLVRAAAQATEAAAARQALPPEETPAAADAARMPTGRVETSRLDTGRVAPAGPAAAAGLAEPGEPAAEAEPALEVVPGFERLHQRPTTSTPHGRSARQGFGSGQADFEFEGSEAGPAAPVSAQSGEGALDLASPDPVPRSGPLPPPRRPGAESDATLAERLLASGRFSEARAAFERAVAREPKHARLRAGLSVACAREAQQRGDLDGAHELLQYALQLEPRLLAAVEGLREVKQLRREVRKGFFRKLFGET